VPGLGAIATADFRISGIAATAGEGPPSVAATQMSVVIGGGWLVVWSDGRNWLDRGTDVYGRRVDSQLGPYGREYRISGPHAYDDDDLPVVASDPGHINDDMMVVWQTNTTARIRGRKMWAGGGPAYPEFAISGPNAEFGTLSASPAVAYNPFDIRYLVVWADWRREATVGSEIYGRYAAG
jgi:hypothetical protein